MKANYNLKNVLNMVIALVWVINGLYCKLLNYVPRHEAIVTRILGDDLGPLLTRSIGLAEIVMAIWVLSQYKPRINTFIQIFIIGIMNIIEFILASDLLLWGHYNIIFAVGFMCLLFWKEFILRES